MNAYEQSKAARRIASVVYLLVMVVILGGTFWSNRQKETVAKNVMSTPVAGRVSETVSKN